MEINVIEKIVVKEKQNRYIQFVSQSKNRHKFISRLGAFNDLNMELFKKVTVNAEIMSELKKNGLEKTLCYIISENEDIDTKKLNVTDA